MKIIVNGRNISLTEAIKSYTLEKFDRLEHHFDFIHEIHVFLSVEKNPRISDNQVAEATIHVNRAVVRVEVASDNLYASIDQLVDKIDRSLAKHKTKLLGRAKSAKGQSIRRAGFEAAVEEEQHLPNGAVLSEDEGVFLTYFDDSEDETVSVG